MALKINRLHSMLFALKAARERVDELRAKTLAERVRVLKQLHADLGFSSRRELVESLVALEGGARTAKRADATSSSTARRRRARLTPEMKQGIIDAVKAGTPGAVVAQRFGVSVQSIQNVKKAAGLVRQRAA